MGEIAQNQTQFKSSGNLEEEVFARILFKLYLDKKTGILDIYNEAPPKGKILKRIYVKYGANFFVMGGSPEETLSKILVHMGKLTEKQWQELFEKAKRDYSKLEQMVLDELKLNPQELSELYQFQTSLKLKNCFSWVKGYYQFQEIDSNDFPKQVLVLPLCVEKLLKEGVFEHFPIERIEKEFNGIEKKIFCTTPQLKQALTSFGLEPKKLKIINALPQRFTLQSLDRTSGLNSKELFPLILCFYIAGYLKLEGEEDFPLGRAYKLEKPEEAPSKPVEKPKVPKPEKPTPTPKEEKKLPLEELLDKELSDKDIIAQIDRFTDLIARKDTTYLDLLSVDRTVPPAQIKKLYFKLARIFHPDAKPQLYRGELREKVEDVFTKISEAYETLTNPELRSNYLKKLDSKVSEAELEKANRAIQAEMEFQKALIALRRGNFKEAEEMLKKVVTLLPDEPEYRIHYAWAIYKTQGKVATEKAKEMLLKALKERDKVAEGHFYLGIIYRTEGEVEKAKDCFNRVLELDPHHTDALRELRIIQMRKDKTPTPSGKGIFGKKS